MKSVNKVILLGNLTRDPEMHYIENKNQSVPLGWQPTEAGCPLTLTRSMRKQSSTALSRGISWPKRAISFSEKAGKSTLRAGFAPGATLIRMT
jgi:hypothetical protein